MIKLQQGAFEQLRGMFFESSGIELGSEKLAMVEARLRGRVLALQLDGFEAYCRYLKQEVKGEERQHAVDLLTINETYFFREPEHFQHLRSSLAERFRGKPLRVWSAACSSGEEPYSIAMTLLDRRPEGGWELRASDLSRRVVERARLGVYPLQRLELMPADYLKRFCLRGTGDYHGHLRVNDQVRMSVLFFAHNLLHNPAALGTFEVIFLRNVLIYFKHEHRGRILAQLADRLCMGGLMFIGTAESLQGHELPLRRVGASVFERV